MEIDNCEEDDASSLIVGYIKQTKYTHLLSFIDIVKLIQMFYFNADINTISTPSPEPMDIDQEICTLKERNSIEPSRLLVDGYIRGQSHLSKSPISVEIYDIIKTFYQKMNGTSFVWHINDKCNYKLLSKIINTNSNNTNFDSDIFQVNTSLTSDGINPNNSKNDKNNKNTSNKLICWYCNDNKIVGYCPHCGQINNLSLKFYLKLYPNSFDIDIILLSLPSKLQNVAFIYQIYCHQLSLYWSSTMTYGIYDGKSRKCQCLSTNINSTYIQSLYELNQLNTLTFYCSFDIFKASFTRHSNDKYNTQYSDIKYNPRYYFDEKKYLNTYKNALFSKFLMTNDEFKIEWNIIPDTVHYLKASIISNYKCIQSDIYYNMWSLSLHHKKIEQKIDNDNDDIDDDDPPKDDVVSIGLQLCSMPSNVSSLIVQIQLFCLQSSSKWSIIKEFNWNNPIYKGGDDADIIITHLNKLTIFCNIIVIEAFDNSGNEMSLQAQQRQHQDVNNGNTRNNSIAYIFQPKILKQIHDSSTVTKYFFQNIGISTNNEFDVISMEELQFEDRNQCPEIIPQKTITTFSNINTSAFNFAPTSISSPLGYQASGSTYTSFAPAVNDYKPLQIVNGSKGWKFKPSTIENKHGEIGYFQHICIGNIGFENKSAEELRLEDYLLTKNYDVKEDVQNNIDLMSINTKFEQIMAMLGKLQDNYSQNKKMGKDINIDWGGFDWKWGADKNGKSHIDKKENCLKTNDVIQVIESKVDGKVSDEKKVKYEKVKGDEILNVDNKMKSLKDNVPLEKDESSENDSKVNDGDDEFKMWYFEKIGFDEYYSLFVENGLNDLDILKDVINDDLIEIGVKKIGHRKKILKEISNKLSVEGIAYNCLKKYYFQLVVILACLAMFLYFAK